MNEQAPKPETHSNVLMLSLLAVCLVAVAAVVFLVVRPDQQEPETVITVIEKPAAEEAGVNVMQVIDATTGAAITPEEGRRYKVLVSDIAREGSSGIARIGGLVTFVPDTQRGEVVVVEITRIKTSTADAVVIERVSKVELPAETPRPRMSDRPSRPPREPEGMEGQVLRGTVTDTGREGDGVVKVDGKVVFVKGATMGQHVEFKVTEDAGRFARAEVVAVSDTPFESEAAAAPKKESAPRDAPPTVAHTDQPVDVGQEHEVTVTEADRRNPDVNGVARIDNFVIFVPGAKIGDRVRIRITELRARSAMSEVIERLEPVPAATP